MSVERGSLNKNMNKRIGKVVLDYTYYDGKDVYNEGNDEENLILDVLREKRDIRKVLESDSRWPVLYQLSEDRKNIVLPMDLRANDEVLEIGAGMGAVTGALAQRTAHVDCIELSERRSLANAYRNEDHDNIHIYVGNYENVKLQKKYDVVTLIGVLEYAGFYIHTDGDSAKEMLNQIYRQMKSGGRLYIAIENRLGLKYFAGCNEDHLGAPFCGIEGYSSKQKVRTFSRSEIMMILQETGFSSLYFYYPYPDYKLPSVIYSDDVLSGDFLPVVENFDMPRIRVFDEKKALESMRNTEEIRVFANSFLIEAVKNG